MSDVAPQDRPKKSLRAKLILLVVLSVATAVSLVSGVSAWVEATRETNLELSRLSATAAVLASTSERAVLDNDRARAFASLRSIAQMPNLLYGRIENAAGYVIVETGQGSRLSTDVAVDLSGVRSATSILRSLKGRTIEVSAPILSGGRKIGRVVILGGSEGALQRLMDGMKLSLSAALLALAAGIAVALRLQQGITRPILALTRSMTDIDFTRHVDVNADDEVGVLVRSFNRMIGEVRERDQRIAAHVSELESIVDDRTRDLKVAKEAAEAANSAKSDFLATMSHEIRTPMNGIMVMAEMLAAGEMPPRQRRFAEVIAKSGSSLLAIINDILDFSKIEAGKLELEAIPCDLSEIVDDVLSLFQERAVSKGLDLASYISPDLPAKISGDPVRLRQVIGNLVNNAIKFTETGGVLVDVRPLKGGVRVAVIDTGVGIPQDKIGSVFGAFSQADQSTTRKFGGTGLGLAICKRLVDSMGGRFDVKSQVGVGSSFAFRWPAAVLEAAAPAPKAPAPGAVSVLAQSGLATHKALIGYLETAGYQVCAPDDPGAAEAAVVFADPMSVPADASPKTLVIVGDFEGGRAFLEGGRAAALLVQPLRRCDLYAVLGQLERGEAVTDPAGERTSATAGDVVGHFQGLNVLVADDSAVNREVAVEALSRLGVTSTTVNDGREALEAVKARRFDLVLMDGSMPEMDGYEASRAIRAFEAETGQARTPIVALTAHVLGPQAEAWKAADMDATLHKPFTLKALSAVIERFHAPTDRKPVADADVREPSEESADGLIDPKVAADLAAMVKNGRASFVRKILKLYADNAPKTLEAVRAAAEAGDVVAAQRQSHALKSMSLNVGARDVARRTAVIEAGAHDGVIPDASTIQGLQESLRATLKALSLGEVEVQTKTDDFPEILRAAMRDQRLALVYQPQFDRDRRFTGNVEALVRWTDLQGKAISPAEFIPLAEQCGVISELTDYVLDLAMRQTKLHHGLKVACNASATEFSSPDFVSRIRAHLERTGYQAERLEIEVTETAILNNDAQVLRNMSELKALGVKVALDDFGAGYSSLLHLRKFPFDKLKIDRDFVISCTEDAQSAAIVHAVISVGRAMGMRITAEGVETEDQFRFLKIAGVHAIQGYLLGKPVPLFEIDRLLETMDAPVAASA